METSPHKEAEFPLPQSVDVIIKRICREQSMPLVDNYVRQLLSEIGEKAALNILDKISGRNITKSVSRYIFTLLKQYHPDVVHSPSNSPNKRPWSPSCSSPHSTLLKKSPPQISRMKSLNDEAVATISEQLKILSHLEYRKLFLVLSYIGKQKLEDVMTIDGANYILFKNDMQMTNFEAEIWNAYGNKYCDRSDRREYLKWDSGKTYFYYCYVHKDGSYHFEGPSLHSTRTHLQRVLGDDNVLIVKFSEDDIRGLHHIEREGILVGQRRFQFLAFKDEHNRKKKNQVEEKGATSAFKDEHNQKMKNQVEEKGATSAIKAHFVRVGSVESQFEDKNYILSGKSIGEARRLFMHIHKVLTMEKYMARFSLILSKTIKLQVNFGDVKVETIEDIPFKDDSGSPIPDEDKKPLVHTDGTGYISEDLAMKCPEDFSRAEYITDNSFEAYNEFMDSGDVSCQIRPPKTRSKEPPLLMQCRLFYNGMAVKGTLLVNKKLKPGVIQVRPSMIKVGTDDTLLPVQEKFNSLEIVAVSHRPGRTYLSKTLIALLSYGGVPPEVFLKLLTDALEDTQKVFSHRRSALRVASNHDGLDFGFAAQIMISCGIPLNEPYLQDCLRYLRKDGKSKLRKGKIPIGESFYLMGTADPTGELENNEVCIILDNGPISGKVLVYRNPGLHFGDIHVMEAVYVKKLKDYVGNSKYGIFFSTKGWKSAAYEMATGDFDGDMYWVSRHPELLSNFKATAPWKRSYSTTTHSNSKKPQELSSEELEHELFRRYIEARKPSFEMPLASNSWLTFMDRLLTLGDDRACEKDCLRKKIIQLIDIYYDAIDAPKSGKRVHFPDDLEVEMYPHHMERRPEYSYNSSSILGQIYDRIGTDEDEDVPKIEIWKLSCFDIPIPEAYITKWKTNYADYCKEMSAALNSGHESKNDAANDVIKKYKQLLYDAPEMEESTKDTTVIYKEAAAIYHVTYDYAKSVNNCSRCNFAWRVAGSALCNLYAWKTAGPKEKPLMILPSVLRDVLN